MLNLECKDDNNNDEGDGYRRGFVVNGEKGLTPEKITKDLVILYIELKKKINNTFHYFQNIRNW
jgi:hypothetical protein